jgi:hypothetical protein
MRKKFIASLSLNVKLQNGDFTVLPYGYQFKNRNGLLAAGLNPPLGFGKTYLNIPGAFPTVLEFTLNHGVASGQQPAPLAIVM